VIGKRVNHMAAYISGTSGHQYSHAYSPSALSSENLAFFTI